MSGLDKLGLAVNKRTNREFLKACVRKKTDLGEVKFYFWYSVVAQKRFAEMTTPFVGVDIALPTRTIRTTNTEISFVKGDLIHIEKESWTVKDIEYDENNDSAMLTGQSKQAVILYLEGGKGGTR
jgi:hypothetical protein